MSRPSDWEYELNNLTPAQFEDGGAALMERAREMAMAEPTPKLRQQKRKEYTDKIVAAQKRFAGLPKNSDMRAQGGPLWREDLGDPAISKLKGQLKMQAGPLGQIYLERMGGGATTASERAYQQFANTVRGLHTRQAFQEFQEWRNANGGAEVPVDMQSNLLEVAAQKVRSSPEYKAAKNAALGLNETVKHLLSQSRRTLTQLRARCQLQQPRRSRHSRPSPTGTQR